VKGIKKQQDPVGFGKSSGKQKLRCKYLGTLRTKEEQMSGKANENTTNPTEQVLLSCSSPPPSTFSL
jgi:hypothetical protein